MKSDHRKPPLAKSPMRLRTHRALRPTNTNTPLRTPIGSMMKKPPMKESNQFSSCQLKALAKMVHDELGAMSSQISTNHHTNLISGSLSVFERGRFYDEYSARRNARLMQKKQGKKDEPNNTNNDNDNNNKSSGDYNLGVKVESSVKKKDSRKKSETLKKSAFAASYSVDRSQHPRYALRSAARKPPLPLPVSIDGEETAVKKSRARRK